MKWQFVIRLAAKTQRIFISNSRCHIGGKGDGHFWDTFAGGKSRNSRWRKMLPAKSAIIKNISFIKMVAGPGIEPGTRGFSVRCSTG
jgi:hypothetical protein